MKTFLTLGALALCSTATVAHAEDDKPKIGGVRVGIEASLTRGSASRDAQSVGATARKSRSGAGYRGFVGYDVPLGGVAIVGIEAGVGGGGRTVTQTGTGGRFAVDPRITYDVTGRAGISPAEGFLLYARGGYRWLQSDRFRTLATVGAVPVRTRRTDGGLTYGLGAEVSLTQNVSLRLDANRTRYNKDFRQDRIAAGVALRF